MRGGAIACNFFSQISQTIDVVVSKQRKEVMENNDKSDRNWSNFQAALYAGVGLVGCVIGWIVAFVVVPSL